MGVKYGLFSVYGIEAEYMIVDKSTLSIKPIADIVLTELNGGTLEDAVEVGDVTVSNELVRHLVELKCTEPVKSIANLDQKFLLVIKQINAILEKHNAMLLGTSMHPWMDVKTESFLWPYGAREIYAKYDEIFSCKGHGWTNLQSVHINLPFNGDEEFEKLHTAIRVVLPLIPYLSASSPYYDGKKGELADNRLAFYEKNQAKIPSIAGRIIPEYVASLADYQSILNGIFKDIAPYDSEGLLQHQWLNSRGAIVKFDVNAIEIRLMDIQESPYMDICLVHFFTAFIKKILKDEVVLKYAREINWDDLVAAYHASKRYEEFMFGPSWGKFLKKLGCEGFKVKEVLQQIYIFIEDSIPDYYHKGIETILHKGNLSKRLTHGALLDKKTYQELASILQQNGIYGINRKL